MNSTGWVREGQRRNRATAAERNGEKTMLHWKVPDKMQESWRNYTSSFCSDDKAGHRFWILVRICCRACTIVLRRVLRYSNMVEIEKVHCCKKWPWWGQRKVLKISFQSIKCTIFKTTVWWNTRKKLVFIRMCRTYSIHQRRKSQFYWLRI